MGSQLDEISKRIDRLEATIFGFNQKLNQHLEQNGEMLAHSREASNRVDRLETQINDQQKIQRETDQRIHIRLDRLEQIEATQTGQTRLLAGLITLIAIPILGYSVWLTNSINRLWTEVNTLRIYVERQN